MPTVSAYQHVHGAFDYNKMPLASLGSAVQMHENKSIRRSWDVRALNGWYLGTLHEHYRCHIIFCQKTRAKQISDTVFFQHRYIMQPVVTPSNQIVKAIDDLRSALRSTINHQGHSKMSTLCQMHNILNGNNNKPEEKWVTFANTVQAPRVSTTKTLTSAPKLHSLPRFPRVATAQIEKPIGQYSTNTSKSHAFPHKNRCHGNNRPGCCDDHHGTRIEFTNTRTGKCDIWCKNKHHTQIL